MSSLAAQGITFNEPGFTQQIVVDMPPGAGNHFGGIVVGPDGNAYIVGGFRPDVYRVTPAGALTTLVLGAGSNLLGVGMVGTTLYAGQDTGRIDTFDISLPAPTPSLLTTVPGALGGNGNADFALAPATFGAFGGQLIACNGGVYAIDPTTGAKTDIVVTGGGPKYSALDFGPDGTLYVADYSARQIITVTAAGVVTPFAALPTADPDGLAVHQGTGDIYVADSAASTIVKITAAGVVTTFATAAFFDGGYYPSGLAFNLDNTVLYYLTNEGAFQLAAIDGFPPVGPLTLGNIPTMGDAGIVVFIVLLSVAAVAIIRRSLI
jgi:sugar lactone lactonase YvrE